MYDSADETLVIEEPLVSGRTEKVTQMSDEFNGSAAEGDVQVMRAGPASDTSKLLAALGYIFFIVAVVLLFIEPYKDEDFVRFHVYQAIALQIVIWIGAAIPVVGWIAGIAGFVIAIIALVKTLQGESWELPIIYPLVKGMMNI
jgi:uncharacterized membrane protein